MSKLRGFTLVETIFSALVISLVILAIMNLYPSAMVAIKRSEGRIQANLVAQSVLERMRTVKFEDLSPGYVPPAGPPFDPVSLDGVTYTPTVEVYDPDPAVGHDFTMAIRARVGWEVRGQQYEVVQETWVHALKR